MFGKPEFQGKVDNGKFLKDAGLEKMSVEGGGRVTEKLYEAVMRRAALKAAKQLSEEDIEAFGKIIEDESVERIESFLSSKIKNYKEQLAGDMGELMEQFRNTIRTNNELILSRAEAN